MVSLALLLSAQLVAASWGEDAGWREVKFGSLKGNRFEARAASSDEPARLVIDSQASMSLWARPVSVDLAQTPILCWRWRVSHALKSADMATKAGDDYAARVYVAFSLPRESLDWGTRTKLALARKIYGDTVPDAALNYVWDNRNAEGHSAPNAYTAQTRMVVQRSGAAQAGRWVHECRDLRADAAKWLPPGAKPVMLAVAADTDNTGEQVSAEFADLGLYAADPR